MIDTTKRTCPIHNSPLVHSRTKYGGRWDCTEPGCTVCCWAGSTSTPADQETRTLRNQCHRLFDPEWREEIGAFAFNSEGERSGGRSKRRWRAYSWLSRTLGVPPPKAHFGMFDAEQCRRALAAISKLIEQRAADIEAEEHMDFEEACEFHGLDPEAFNSEYRE